LDAAGLAAWDRRSNLRDFYDRKAITEMEDEWYTAVNAVACKHLSNSGSTAHKDLVL
jgi:hypothetical protein